MRRGVWILFICCVVGALTLEATPALAQETNLPVVVTTGERIVRTAPDCAYVTATAEARAQNPKDAQQQGARAMASVMAGLKQASLPADAIRTLAYEIHPEFDYVEGKQRLRGYVARNTIEVRLDTLDRVGEMLDLIVGSGASVVTGLRFDRKDRTALEREALKQAVADALARAEAAAAGAGQAVARIQRIEESRVTVQPPQPLLQAMRAEAAAVAETPITPGEIEIRAQVTLTAILK